MPPRPDLPPRIVGPTLAAMLLALVTGCAPTPGPSNTPTATLASAPSAVTDPGQVAGATVSGLFDETVTLADGHYQGRPIVAGSAARPTATLLRPLVTLGELDEAPGDDAAAVIATNEGGSGERIWLSVIGMRGGKAVSLATTLVGDRTKIRRLRLQERTIVLDVVEVGPGEPACCGSQLATRTYRLTAGRLELAATEVTGRLSLATLAGVTWTAVAIDREPLPEGTRPPTLTLVTGQADGTAPGARLAGFTGCNQYSGSVRESEPGTIAVGPAVATRMACPGDGMAVEARYLKALEHATQYTFLAGRLHLSGLDGDTMRAIEFAPR